MKAKMFFLILFVVLPAGLIAQATDCNDPNVTPQINAAAQRQWESRKSPVYQDATDLAKTLNERGIHVQCIRRSVGERVFAGEKGAAWFRTDQGVFDVWFLPQAGDLCKIRNRRTAGEWPIPVYVSRNAANAANNGQRQTNLFCAFRECPFPNMG